MLCSKSFTLQVNGNTCEIDNADPLPDGDSGVAYSETLTASGVSIPLAWSVVGGALPDGLSLGLLTGEISGVPTAAVDTTYGFTVRVDGSDLFCEKTFSITINVLAECGGRPTDLELPPATPWGVVGTNGGSGAIVYPNISGAFTFVTNPFSDVGFFPALNCCNPSASSNLNVKITVTGTVVQGAFEGTTVSVFVNTGVIFSPSDDDFIVGPGGFSLSTTLVIPPGTTNFLVTAYVGLQRPGLHTGSSAAFTGTIDCFH